MLARIKNKEIAALRITIIHNKHAFNNLYTQILKEHGCSEKTHYIDLNTGFIQGYAPLPNVNPSPSSPIG